MSVGKRTVLTVGAVLVLLAVIGAVYLEIAIQAASTRTAWMVIDPEPAGAVLTNANVRQVTIPTGNAGFTTLADDPVNNEHPRRLSHGVVANHLLAPDDLLQKDMALIPVSFKSQTPLKDGDVIDVYAQAGQNSPATLVGPRVTVQTSSNAGTYWILVSARDEGQWIQYLASGANLYAARVDGGADAQEGSSPGSAPNIPIRSPTPTPR